MARDLTGWGSSKIGGDKQARQPRRDVVLRRRDRDIVTGDVLQSFDEFEASADLVKLADGVGPQKFPPLHSANSVSPFLALFPSLQGDRPQFLLSSPPLPHSSN